MKYVLFISHKSIGYAMNSNWQKVNKTEQLLVSKYHKQVLFKFICYFNIFTCWRLAEVWENLTGKKPYNLLSRQKGMICHFIFIIQYAHARIQSCINVPGQAVVLFAPAHFWKDQHWPALWQCDFQGQIVGFLWLSLMPAATLLLCSALLPMPKKMFAEIISGF